MRTFEVCFTPALLHLFDLKDKTVVVVDILRATTSMVTAFAHGVAEILPVAEIEECEALRSKGYLGAAERNGFKVDGFDLDNSPLSYMGTELHGMKIAMTTTNGTKALVMSKDAKEILVGAFINLEAMVNYLKENTLSIVVVCAGWKGHFNLEDSLYAGALAYHLQEEMKMEQDATLASLNLYQNAKENLSSLLGQCSHSKRLQNFDLDKDFDFCLQESIYNVIPIWKDSTLKKLHLSSSLSSPL